MSQISFYLPQTKFAKVLFLQVSVCPRGGVNGWGGGHAWLGRGVCVAREGVCVAGGCVWLGVYMANGMCG